MARPRRPQRIVDSYDESQHSPKEDSSTSSSSEDGDEDAESDEDQPQKGFVDLEAVDDDDDTESSETSDDSSLDGSDSTFHQFTQLPPELRNKIWEFFCPELTAPIRLLRIGLEFAYDVLDNEAKGYFFDGPYLDSMTETFRCLSSIHRESRQRALKLAPDELPLRGHAEDAVLRINSAKDILCLQHCHQLPVSQGSLHSYMPLGQQQCGGFVHNIAMETANFEKLNAILLLFPEVKVVYNISDEIRLNDRWLRWCASDYAHKYFHERVEDIEPVPEVLPMLLCFPDIVKYKDFAKYNLAALAHAGFDHMTREDIAAAEIEVQPMVSFAYASGLDRFEELEKLRATPLPQLPQDEEPSDAEEEAMAADRDIEDDYESEGINDETIIEDEYSSEDELIPRPISPGSGVGSPISVDSGSEDEPAAANLSSIEPSEDEEQEEAPATSKRKRRVVSDSDDDEEVAGPAQNTRTSAFGHAKRRRVARTLQSDSETEEGDVRPPTAAKAVVEVSDDEDSSSESSSAESEEALSKPLSLAQRLRQQQPGRPISADESNSEYGSDRSDESSPNDEDDDDRPRRGGAFFMDEASEDEDDDGDEDDESDM